MRKIIINEDWQEEEILDPEDICAVILKQGSNDGGYVKSFDIDNHKMQDVYNDLTNQYADVGTDGCLNIYLIQLPNTNQVNDLLKVASYNGEERDPEAIAAVNALCNRPDCEILESWSPSLTEAKKKKKVCDSITYTTGYPDWDIKHFNKMMGTDGLGDSRQSFVAGDTLPNGPVADAESSDGASDAGSSDAGSSAGEGGAVGESLAEDIEKELKIQDNENIEKDIEELEPPIDPEYFPNNMGINLSSVKKEKWVQQDDGQLKTITIEFDPATEEEKEELTEAHLDYSTQLAKMKALENGTRGFNAASASLEKILYNYEICISHNLPRARKAMEDALRLHGWDKYIKQTKLPCARNFKVDPQQINAQVLGNIWGIIKVPGSFKLFWETCSWKDAVIALLLALFSKDKVLADSVKDGILNRFNITISELKDLINDNLADKDLFSTFNGFCITYLTDSLNEATMYSHKLMKNVNIPDQIKLLPQKQVEDFIKQLAPEEEFYAGYITPVYFYSELDNKFDLVKATQMLGYTGIDYRDALADQNAAEHDARLANAQRQIDTYTDGASGFKMNPEGEKFSTSYRATNKLALNPKKANDYKEITKDASGNNVEKKIDLSKILFYPKVNSKPQVTYFLDLHDGKGFKKIERNVLVDTLYKAIVEKSYGAASTLSETDEKWLIKQGYGKNINDALVNYKKAWGNMPVCICRKASALGVDPVKYWKDHPYSPRWSLDDFVKKVGISLASDDPASVIASDAETQSDKELDKRKGWSPETGNIGGGNFLNKLEDKPQVRALYSNQIYWLYGEPGRLGYQLEGLHEDFEQPEQELTEAKRYVKRYYIRPQNIFASNKEDILKALVKIGDQNCSVYSLKNLSDHDDVHLLKPSDIIYYYDDHVLYDKNHVQVMDYDLFVKHEEERKKFADVDAVSDSVFDKEYDDRLTDADLKDKEAIANYKAINQPTLK